MKAKTLINLLRLDERYPRKKFLDLRSKFQNFYLIIEKSIITIVLSVMVLLTY